MINVNSNLKNAITGKGSQLIKITGSCYDTSNVYHSFTWTNADIVQGSFYVDKRCVSGSQFSFGNTVSNELGFELFGPYTDWLLEGVMVTVSLGGYVSGVATYFEVGKFILEKPAQDMDRLTCHGYDLLTKLDQNADNWVMNANSGENILGQAIKPSPAYLMNADGYQNYIAGSVTSPYYNSNPLSAATGMVPLAQNGRYPQKIVIKATGPTVDLSSSYFLLFRYNGGVLENVSGMQWPFINAPLHMTASTISAGEYHIDFGLNTDETYFQEYLESNYGVNDYYATFTLTTSATPSFSAIEIGYDRVAAAKIGDIVDDACEACGLDFFAGYPAPVNLTEAYTNLADYSQYSYRTILGLFAQACGANLTLWPSGYGLYNGQVRFAVPTTTGVALDETKVLSCELADEPVLINGARFVSSSGALFINTTDNTEPYKYFDFTGCPVFPKDAQTAVDNLAGFTGASNTWLPGKAKILAMPWLEPMDIVTFNYTVKPNYTGKFLITRVRIGANGATYIESAGYYQSTTNSNGYVPTDYTQVDPFGLVYSSFSETVTPGTTTNVAMSTFTHNMPTPNDYVVADSGFGIVTDVNGSFAEVLWLAVYSGGGGGGTTYTFADGTNSFTVTPAGGTPQKVNVTPSIANNITGVGTSGSIAKFGSANTITSGPAFGLSTTTFLRNDGTWHALTDDGTISQLVSDVSDAQTDISALEAEQEVLDARMDAFIALPDGSTTADAELVDIRIGADGITYPSAGDAVRGQYSVVADDLAAIEEKEYHESPNLLNFSDEDFTEGYYVNPTYGSLTQNATYNTSGYIPVEAGSTYTYTYGLPLGTPREMRFIAAYNESKSIVGSAGANSQSTYTVPSGVAYIRFSAIATYFKESANDVMFFKGITIDRYYAYYPPYYTYKVKNTALDADYLNGLINAKLVDTVTDYGISISATAASMSSTDTLTVVQNMDNKKNASIEFLGYFSSFTSLTLGHGYNVAYGNYIVIDNTHLTVYYGATPTQMSQVSHGLTISNFIQVVITQGDGARASVKIITATGNYTLADCNWHGCCGNVFAKVGAAMTDCICNAVFRDFNEKFFLFGDSYVSMGDPTRYPYYLVQNGYTHLLIDGWGGRNSVQGLTSFQNTIAKAVPKYAIWALGMNDGDTSSAVNASWLSCVQTFLSDCETNGITPILATIPNCPNVRNTYKNAWIKAHDYKYVDFAKGVGAEEAGSSWYTGMLSSDNIHPTELGAKALYARLITDVPDLLK